jgi:hypothetical protein
LLAAGGHDDAGLRLEVLNITADGEHVAGQELGEVLLGEQAPPCSRASSARRASLCRRRPSAPPGTF